MFYAQRDNSCRKLGKVGGLTHPMGAVCMGRHLRGSLQETFAIFASSAAFFLPKFFSKFAVEAGIVRTILSYNCLG